MKKLIALTAFFCLAFTLTACAAKLPEGMTEEAVTSASQETVAQLSDGSYDALIETMTEEMKSALTKEKLIEVWEPVQKEAGAFKSIKKTTVGSKSGYAVAVVNTEYENKTIIFTLSYTADMKLGGLFFK